jgi:hypothetical protein
MSDLARVIEERAQRVEALLADALRVEIGFYFTRQIQGRIMNRPHWLSRTPRIMFETMRTQTDQCADELLPQLVGKLAEVRAALGTERDPDAELVRVVAAIAPLLKDAARSLLLFYFVNGDSYPDTPKNDIDLEPEFDLTYEPTPTLGWAFAQARMLDVARRRWAQRTRDVLAPTFELRMYLPEALRDDLRDGL